MLATPRLARWIRFVPVLSQLRSPRLQIAIITKVMMVYRKHWQDRGRDKNVTPSRETLVVEDNVSSGRTFVIFTTYNITIKFEIWDFAVVESASTGCAVSLIGNKTSIGGCGIPNLPALAATPSNTIKCKACDIKLMQTNISTVQYCIIDR